MDKKNRWIDHTIIFIVKWYAIERPFNFSVYESSSTCVAVQKKCRTKCNRHCTIIIIFWIKIFENVFMALRFHHIYTPFVGVCEEYVFSVNFIDEQMESKFHGKQRTICTTTYVSKACKRLIKCKQWCRWQYLRVILVNLFDYWCYWL